ncbi:MAG TPA: peptide-methionine (S)-S-oxide reductase MsrA [Solirubrobacterales bacterium]|nr:peptide-methionine (S)-S-oxide reductase MsrA [Solirubrobacterales bacterium]
MSNPAETRMPAPEEALPGRSELAYEIEDRHAIFGTPLKPPFPEGIEVAYFALGCYWAAEQVFWTIDGVYTTATGFMNGTTPNPTSEEVETGETGHAETVLVAFDPAKVTYADLLELFFEQHDPTQGMRQGSEVGTWNRSGIYFVDDAQRVAAEAALKTYGEALRAAGHDPITTEVDPATPFYYAEDDDQQYLHKFPKAIHCALVGTGVPCRIPTAAP